MSVELNNYIDPNKVIQILFDGKETGMNPETQAKIYKCCQEMYTIACQMRDCLEQGDHKYRYYSSLRHGNSSEAVTALSIKAGISPKINSLLQILFLVFIFNNIKMYFGEKLSDHCQKKSTVQFTQLEESFKERYTIVRNKFGLKRYEAYDYHMGKYNILLAKYARLS